MAKKKPAKKMGRPTFYGGTMAVTPIRLPTSTLAEIDALARANKVSRSEEMRRLLEFALAARRKRRGD